MDYNSILKVTSVLMSGLSVSIKIFILTLIFSLPLGIIVSLLCLSKNKIISFITKIYILIMRGTPLLLQIICIYFMPYYLFNVSYDRFIAIIIAFSLNYAAYFGEIFRGGIESIPKGQFEVAYTLGFDKFKTFIYIILPQTIKRVLSAVANEVITLIRDTSLAQVIGITELFSLAEKQSNYNVSIYPLILAGLIYLLISMFLTLIFNYTERKLNYYR